MLKLVKSEPIGARGELQQHLGTIVALQKQLQPLIDAQCKRNELRAEELRLASELDSINDTEKRDWQEYTTAGSVGDPPRPRTPERNRVVVALQEASRLRMDHDATVGAIEPAITDLNRELNALIGETNKRIDAVLAEIAEVLVDRYQEQLRQVIQTENALLGLRDAAQARGNGSLMSTITGWLKRGRDDAHSLHDGARQTRTRWRALADRLATDPDAEETMP